MSRWCWLLALCFVFLLIDHSAAVSRRTQRRHTTDHTVDARSHDSGPGSIHVREGKGHSVVVANNNNLHQNMHLRLPNKAKEERESKMHVKMDEEEIKSDRKERAQKHTEEMELANRAQESLAKQLEHKRQQAALEEGNKQKQDAEAEKRDELELKLKLREEQNRRAQANQQELNATMASIADQEQAAEASDPALLHAQELQEEADQTQQIIAEHEAAMRQEEDSKREMAARIRASRDMDLQQHEEEMRGKQQAVEEQSKKAMEQRQQMADEEAHKRTEELQQEAQSESDRIRAQQARETARQRDIGSQAVQQGQEEEEQQRQHESEVKRRQSDVLADERGAKAEQAAQQARDLPQPTPAAPNAPPPNPCPTDQHAKWLPVSPGFQVGPGQAIFSADDMRRYVSCDSQSWAFWVKVRSLDKQSPKYGLWGRGKLEGNDQSPAFFVGSGAEGGVCAGGFEVRSAGQVVNTCAGTMPDEWGTPARALNTWVHVAMSHDNSVLRVMVNGQVGAWINVDFGPNNMQGALYGSMQSSGAPAADAEIRFLYFLPRMASSDDLDTIMQQDRAKLT